MPCLNEEKTLEVCITKALKSISEMGIEGEVIVADNGSTDRSILIANKAGARVVNIPRKGYGAALRGGIIAADYEYIIMGDADDSYDFSSLNLFVEKLDEGYDLVMGNRFKGGIEKGAMPFSHQYIGNPFLSGLGRIFFKTKIGDFHCGLRAFRKEKIMEIGLCTPGMEFASEMVVKSLLFGLKIAEVPCKLYPDGRDRAPHLRSIPDGLRHLEFLLIYSPKWLFAYPGLLLFFIGMLFTVWIYINPIQIGSMQLEQTTMLYSALAMLMGTQFLQFSYFTGEFARRVGQIPTRSKLMDKIKRIVNKLGYKMSVLTIITGFVGIIYTFITWGRADFGELTTTFVCKTAILFGSLFALGVQILLFTLFSRVLQMGEVKDE